MYEFFEHTADIGLRIRSADLNSLFAEAGKALFSTIIDNLEAVQPIETYRFQVATDRLDDLLHDWLDELLFAFNTKHIAAVEFSVQVRAGELEAVVRGEPFVRSRHDVSVEVKAITYHGLRVEREDDGWLAEVILDI